MAKAYCLETLVDNKINDSNSIYQIEKSKIKENKINILFLWLRITIIFII